MQCKGCATGAKIAKTLFDATPYLAHQPAGINPRFDELMATLNSEPH
ncbi:hypothetical protein FM102_02415 [Corynebacterium glutamicum]|nr:hypothetical protein FM102_02415 [Corynebacterium glutamicum]